MKDDIHVQTTVPGTTVPGIYVDVCTTCPGRERASTSINIVPGRIKLRGYLDSFKILPFNLHSFIKIDVYLQ